MYDQHIQWWLRRQRETLSDGSHRQITLHTSSVLNSNLLIISADNCYNFEKLLLACYCELKETEVLAVEHQIFMWVNMPVIKWVPSISSYINLWRQQFFIIKWKGHTQYWNEFSATEAFILHLNWSLFYIALPAAEVNTTLMTDSILQVGHSAPWWQTDYIM